MIAVARWWAEGDDVVAARGAWIEYMSHSLATRRLDHRWLEQGMHWSARSEQLAVHPDSLRVVSRIGKRLVESYGSSPRASSMFASQQRWLMSHVAMKLYFGASDASGGLTRRSFVQAVLTHELASRNTARAIMAEALHYGMVRPVVPTGSKTSRDSGAELLEMSDVGIALILEWFAIHLKALDEFDGGNRVGTFSGNPIAALTVMEPFVCDELLACTDVRSPGPAYAHFTWMDQGGLLMDRLMAGIDADSATPNGQSVTDITSISELARRFALSRSHVARKLVDGEGAGHIGWTGRRGHSAMWISSGFRKDYARAQMLKLVIIDAAFETAFAS